MQFALFHSVNFVKIFVILFIILKIYLFSTKVVLKTLKHSFMQTKVRIQGQSEVISSNVSLKET